MSTPGTHTFTVTDSETLVDAPILAVRRDQVVMPGGGTADREIVEHFGAVAVVAYDAERGAVAMVRQYRHAVGTRLLELPAGILDFAGEVANSIAVAGVLAAHDVLRHGAAVRPADAEFTLRPQALARRRQAAGIAPDMKKL